MQRGSTVDYYEADGLGSITSLTATNGTVAQSYTYDSFGNQTASSGSLTNFFRYTGREFDTETNLYYNRARYFDPSTGRFLSEDPVGFGGDGTDFYAYVENDATDWVDPFGLQHKPGGPTHFENIRCRSGEPCPELLDKIEKWAQQIASHYLWDWTHGTNRHQQPGPRGGPSDVDQMWNGLENCLKIYYKECVNCKQGPSPVPAPSPSPSPNPAPGPVPIPFMPLPSPGMPPVLPEPPIPFPEPLPIPEPIPIPFF